MQFGKPLMHCENAIKCLSSGGTLEGSLAHVAPWYDAGAFLLEVFGRNSGAHSIWLTLVSTRIDILRQKIDALHDGLEQAFISNVALPREGRFVSARIATMEKEIAQLVKHLNAKNSRSALAMQQENQRVRTVVDRMLDSPTHALTAPEVL